MSSLIIVGVVVVIALLILGVIANAYKKPSTNEALVVTGLFLKESRIVIGRGVFVIPVFQDYKSLALDAFTIPVTVRNANTSTQVPLDVEGNATLNIGSDDTLVRAASQKLLGKSDEERDEILSGVVKGSVRGILGDMNPEDVPNKKRIFQEKVISMVSSELAEFGIEIRSIQITNVTDQQGFIESLYASDVANRKRDAEIKSATAESDTRKAVAKLNQEALASEQEAQRQIAEQEKTTEVIKAEYKAEQDKAQAVADQAYALSEAEASKKVIETEGQANRIKAEQEAIVSEKTVQVAENRLRADVVAKTDAQAKADVINAEAEAKVTNLSATAESDKVRLLGQAEADKVSAIGTANAEAQRKMAQALAEDGERVLMQTLIEKLPELAQAYADAIKSIDTVTIVGGSNDANGSAMTGMIDGGMAQMFQAVKSTTGLDLADIIKQRGEGRLTLAGEPLATLVDKVTDTETPEK